MLLFNSGSDRAAAATSDHFLSLLKDLRIHTHTFTLRTGSDESGPVWLDICCPPPQAQHCWFMQGPDSQRPPSSTTGLKEQEIGWTPDNGPVDRLIMQLLSFLIESLHQLHFCRSQSTIQTRSNWSLVLWFTPDVYFWAVHINFQSPHS